MENHVDSRLLPQSLENEIWSYLLRFGARVALSGQHKEYPLGETGEGARKRFYLTLRSQLVHPPHRGNNTLDGLLVLPAVLHKLEVFVGPTFLTLANMGVSLRPTISANYTCDPRCQ